MKDRVKQTQSLLAGMNAKELQVIQRTVEALLNTEREDPAQAIDLSIRSFYLVLSHALEKRFKVKQPPIYALYRRNKKRYQLILSAKESLDKLFDQCLKRERLKESNGMRSRFYALVIKSTIQYVDSLPKQTKVLTILYKLRDDTAEALDHTLPDYVRSGVLLRLALSI